MFINTMVCLIQINNISVVNHRPTEENLVLTTINLENGSFGFEPKKTDTTNNYTTNIINESLHTLFQKQKMEIKNATLTVVNKEMYKGITESIKENDTR